MKVHIKKQYYKNIRRGKEPCKYTAVQPKGVNTDVYATIRLDPILKKPKLKAVKKAMVNHEKTEISRWGRGDNHSHRDAERREPKLTRDKIKGVKGFWRFCKKNGV